MNFTFPNAIITVIQINPPVDLTPILERLSQIMVTQAEIATALDAANVQLADTKASLDATTAIVVKVGTETDGLLDKIAILQDAVNNASEASPAVAAALTNVQATLTSVVASAQAVKDAAKVDDDKVADAA